MSSDPLEIRRGTGRVFPTMFVPPTEDTDPQTLFPPSGRCPMDRYRHRDDARKVLIYTDGACSNNGQPNPKAAWAFVFKPTIGGAKGSVSSRLENKGPFGDIGNQTGNRAELRAVLAALRFRCWDGEGFNTVVVATDSEYVALGATRWVRTWVGNGWRTSTGAVKNRDLWEMLLGELETLDSYGVKVQFWRIPRELNCKADKAAKLAARVAGNRDEFTDCFGALV
ncbi:hypothetical protein E4U42_007964 [Claviceps africana]|uniref:ribonuclease H n=1 Tax=Claviceps africana TaxID=83212 RepID=A0A8K0J189_9HYPO|nr:hypothetical protein E4U42_007964 [Claviceps africana]